jgi:hypothetical protein
LRRSVLVGKPWPERLVLVRATDAAAAIEAAKAGADGVLVDGQADPELVEAAHAHGIRALVTGPLGLIELAAADGVVGGELPPELARRFPETRAFALDLDASRALAAQVSGRGAPLPPAARGLVEAEGLAADALALVAPGGAIVDRKAFPMLDARRRHAALRAGSVEVLESGPTRYGAILASGGDRATLLINLDEAPWPLKVTVPSQPLDLLGGKVEDGQATVAPHDVALLVGTPVPDRTRY